MVMMMEEVEEDIIERQPKSVRRRRRTIDVGRG